MDDDGITQMKWEQKVELIRCNPIMTARHFDHRFRIFFHEVVKPVLGFDEQTDDFFFRIEFQNRGSPHVHMIMWLEGAPKYGVDDEETICNFIDKHVSVDLPCDSLSEVPYYLECQIHRHKATCKKKHRKKCRFHFPRPPMSKTQILKPLDIYSIA